MDDVSFLERLKVVVKAAWQTDADLCVLTRYEKPEVWVQLFILKLRRKKAIFFCDATANDQPPSKIKGLIKRILFQSADGIFGYGMRARDYVVGFGVKPNNWHKRCQAAALPHDYSPEKALEKRLKISAAVDAPRYLYLGRLSPEKNLIMFLEAFVQVQAKIPKAELVIVGGGVQEEELRDYAQTLGLDADAIFLGSKSGDDLYDEYAKATCFVLPSMSEPWGLVVNEALHYGCPVIVSDRCGCVPELVIEGETGFSHDPKSLDDLVRAMVRASEAFADTDQTAQACLALMQDYTPKIAAQQMIEGFRKVLD